MRKKEMKEHTNEWELLEKGRNYLSRKNLYANTNLAFRFFNGDQWQGLKKGLVEPITLNFLKPIVKYKIGVVNGNGYDITFNPNNYNDPRFQVEMSDICDSLNEYIAILWENKKINQYTRTIAKDACICGEGIIYLNYDIKEGEIIPELIDNTEIYYENENSENLQENDYIIITSRSSLREIREEAERNRKDGLNSLTEEDIKKICGDNKTEYQAGDYANDEVNDMVTTISFFKKKDGTVWFSKATETCVIEDLRDLGLKRYPIAHFVWESVKGSARGMGEINKATIANQIEVNKTATRESAAITMTAYPKMVVNRDRIANPTAVNKVGSVIYTKDKTVEDVSKVIGYINAVPLSSDAQNFKNELISHTRELSGAGDQLTGNINPERASGQAILAVQQQGEQTMTEQLIRFKDFLEDIANIVFEMWKVYTDKKGKTIITKEDIESIKEEQPTVPEGVDYSNPYSEKTIEETEEKRQADFDERIINNRVGNGNELIDLEKSQGDVKKKEIYISKVIPKEIIEKLEVNVKVDVTPNTPFDKYAYQQSMDTLLQSGVIDLEEWIMGLKPDSAIPRQPFFDLLQRRKEKETQINILDQEAEKKKAEMDANIEQAEQQADAQALQQQGENKQLFYQDVTK
ncbi:hypothetical protein [Anaerofustis stercorihominis]|uniref:Phage portal protein n=1 Tax=Anaerofustis stercorihominis TaxID=214853 RepID=A0A3E3DX29_9FIRM|nr:hypothetical protein [Anaerofustis stercorihominis]RGD73822.1 hypothetical protein DW687_08580 [Anaerofustis stercorihominis]